MGIMNLSTQPLLEKLNNLLHIKNILAPEENDSHPNGSYLRTKVLKGACSTPFRARRRVSLKQPHYGDCHASLAMTMR
ncbi:MAG: hypothetical protein ACI9SX_001602 [Pseudoalteromonas tetraodonis]